MRPVIDASTLLDVVDGDEIDQLIELLLLVVLVDAGLTLSDRAVENGLRYRPPGVITTLIAPLQGSKFIRLFLKGPPNYCYTITRLR